MRGHTVQVRYAMRYGHPSIASQLDLLKLEGVTRILILPAYPRYSGTTTASVFDVVGPGFTGDCLETLEEIAMEARQAFLKAGGKEFSYIECLNDSPQRLAALSALSIQHMGGWHTAAPIDLQALADSRTRAKALGAAQ